MATHCSILAWRIPETEEPSGLPSVGLHRVGDDWSDLAEENFNLQSYFEDRNLIFNMLNLDKCLTPIKYHTEKVS